MQRQSPLIRRMRFYEAARFVSSSKPLADISLSDISALNQADTSVFDVSRNGVPAPRPGSPSVPELWHAKLPGSLKT